MPVLDQTSLQQVVCSATVNHVMRDVVRGIEPDLSVYDQCRFPRIREQHAAQLFRVRLKVSVADFDRLTAARPDDGSAGPVHIEHVCWPKQVEVAQRLFAKTNEVLDKLNSDSKSISDFRGVEFMVLTPAFQTLQQQTANRLVKSGILPQDKPASDCVIMYTRSERHDRLFERFKTRARENKDILFVLVADECHNGCTNGGAHDTYVNDQRLHSQDNFVLLGVSATPYNCLTNKSRVDKSNVIEWFALMKHARTAPTEDEVAGALSAKVACIIEPRLLVVGYRRRDKSFFVKNMSESKTFRLEHNEASILTKLGFPSETLELAPGCEKLANEKWKIGNDDQWGGRSLEGQRIRADPGFTNLRAKFDSAFGRKRETRRRKHDISNTRQANSPRKSVALHDGHLILAEYLFSLVCLSMFRQKGPTMRMKRQGAHEKVEEFLDGLGLGLESESESKSDTCLARFIDKIESVCTFFDGQDSFDITSVMKFVTQTYISSAREELTDELPDDDVSELDGNPIEIRLLCQQNRACVRRILRQKLKASADAESTSEEESWFNETDRILRDLVGGGGRSGHGRMVVIRVYEREEQLSMQHCLRQAVKKLDLTHGDPEQPLFSVVCDNGDTSLSQSIEEYFRNDFNLQADGDGHSTLSDRMRELRNLPGSRNASLSYEDLLNVPMILILCEKGRMGDTFPHSLGCFDLRLRVAGYFSSFKQELGRLCRYAKFRPKWSGSGASHEDARTLGFEALNRKRLVKVSTSAGLVSVVDTRWQLNAALDSVGGNDHLDLEESVFPLPTALVPTPTMKKLLKAVGEHRLTQTPISKCIRMQQGMNLHMRGPTNAKQRPITATNNALHNYALYSPAPKHFDHVRDPNKPTDPRRLILSAECQIGKTGAYLEYLANLIRATNPMPSPPPLVVEDGCPTEVLRWLLPDWQSMHDKPAFETTYRKLLAGKYTKGIAMERAHLVAKSCENEEWKASYAELLKDSCGEHVRSKIGQRMINTLRDTDLDAPFGRDGSPRQTSSGYESLKQAINWDGRFGTTDNGVQLCACEDQCACEEDARAGPFGKRVLKLSMAELARTGGQHGCVDLRWETTREGREGPPVSAGQVREFAAKQPPCDWINGVAGSELKPCIFRQASSDATFTLNVSIPNSGVRDRFENPEDPGLRWIFTPSYNRAAPGPRQALLDRSAALQSLHHVPDVGPRFHINVLVVRWEQFASYRRYFGHEYVIMEMPSRMACKEHDEGFCTPAEGGIGYARHFIQQWCDTKQIPFAWMLDDNVQLCHEFDVVTGQYKPCGFTHVMDSLERVLLLHDRTDIVINSLPHSVFDKAADLGTCPPDLQLLRNHGLGDATTPPMRPTSVADFCGNPDHYGLLGISRHGLGNENTQAATPHAFDVNHSVYSFCLLNVRSTVKEGAFYPFKRYWEDIEFNHIVDEKGLVVCMFRKFSHSKRNLQPLQPQPTLLCPTPAFEHRAIGLGELQETYENIRTGSTMVISPSYLCSLLEYISCHVLGSINPLAIAYPSDRGDVVLVGDTFQVVPAVPEQQNPMIELQTAADSRIVLIMLLGGLENESLGLLKHVIAGKIITGILEKVVVVTRLPQRNGNAGMHIGQWLQHHYTGGSNIQVQAEIVKPEGRGLGHGLLVLSFRST